MFCSQCGTQLKEDQKFCTNCGSSVKPTLLAASPVHATISPSPPAVGDPAASRLISEPSRPPTAIAAPGQLEPGAIVPGGSPEVVTEADDFEEVEEKRINPLHLWGGITAAVLAIAVLVVLSLHSPRQANVPDAEIEKSLLAKFASDANLSRCNVKVSSQNGLVILSGQANSSSDRSTASNIAMAQPGVRTVVDNLVLAAGAQPNASPSTARNVTSTLSAGGTIRTVDFQDFAYSTNGFGGNTPARVVHVSNGQAKNQDEDFWVGKPVYGDLKGNGQEEAVVVLTCHPSLMSPNVASGEVFIFEMSDGGPKVLAKLPSSYWKDAAVVGTKVSERLLAVDFLEMGEHGFGACPEWIVTKRFRWKGSHFAAVGESRRHNSCWRDGV